MDCIVCGILKSGIWLSNFRFHFHLVFQWKLCLLHLKKSEEENYFFISREWNWAFEEKVNLISLEEGNINRLRISAGPKEVAKYRYKQLSISGGSASVNSTAGWKYLKFLKVPKSKIWTCNYLNSTYLVLAMISKVALVVKKLPANAGDIRDAGLIPGLEEGMAIHPSIIAWRILRTEEPGGLRSMGCQSRTRLKQLSSSRAAVQKRKGGIRPQARKRVPRNLTVLAP